MTERIGVVVELIKHAEAACLRLKRLYQEKLLGVDILQSHEAVAEEEENLDSSAQDNVIDCSIKFFLSSRVCARSACAHARSDDAQQNVELRSLAVNY